MKKLAYFIIFTVFVIACKTSKVDIVTSVKNPTTPNGTASSGEIQFQPQFIDFANSTVNARLEATEVTKIIVISIINNK